MKCDPNKLEILEEEAYRRHLSDLKFKFWPELAVGAGYTKTGAGWLSSRCRGGHPFKRPAINRIAAGLGHVLGREIALEDFIVDEDVPALNGDRHPDAKEVGSANR